jgi:hypothetical protein
MTTPKNTVEADHRVAVRRSRWVENLTLAWWAAGAAFTTVDALAYRSSAGAAVVRPEAINHGLLAGVPAGAMTVALALLALVGTALAVWMRWGRRMPSAARVATLAGVGIVLAGAVVLVDATVLAGLGYLPALLVVSTFDAATREALGVYVEPAFLLQVAVLVGAVLLAATAVRFARRSAGACERCGRRHDGLDPAWTTPASAARWGRIAALVAAAIPAFYGITRLAWAVGIPLGFSREHVEGFTGIDLIGPIGLGSFAMLGAVLTLGLYQHWGEVFPRWMVGLAGRRVPVGLAVVPATLVAVAVLPAGISVIAMGLQRGVVTAELWGAVGPGFLWPLWSVALGAATYAYWLRRRGRCRTCGQG